MEVEGGGRRVDVGDSNVDSTHASRSNHAAVRVVGPGLSGGIKEAHGSEHHMRTLHKSCKKKTRGRVNDSNNLVLGDDDRAKQGTPRR